MVEYAPMYTQDTRLRLTGHSGPWDIMTGVPYDNHRSWGAGHDS